MMIGRRCPASNVAAAASASALFTGHKEPTANDGTGERVNGDPSSQGTMNSMPSFGLTE